MADEGGVGRGAGDFNRVAEKLLLLMTSYFLLFYRRIGVY